MDWITVAKGQVAGSCGCGNEPSDFKKMGIS